MKIILAGFLLVAFCVCGLTGCGKSMEEKVKEKLAKDKADAAQQQALQVQKAQQAKANEAAQAQEKLLGVLKSVLKDADTAKIQNVKIKENPFETPVFPKLGYAICGEINAKNSYGAFTGFSGFVVGTSMKTDKLTIMMQNDKEMESQWRMYASEIGCI